MAGHLAPCQPGALQVNPACLSRWDDTEPQPHQLCSSPRLWGISLHVTLGLTQKSRGFGCISSTEPPGLSKLSFEICWQRQRQWLWLDPCRAQGPFPATHVSHIASEKAASQAVSITLRVQMPGGRDTTPGGWLERPSESRRLTSDHDVPG